MQMSGENAEKGGIPTSCVILGLTYIILRAIGDLGL